MKVNCTHCNLEINKRPNQLEKFKISFCNNKCQGEFRRKESIKKWLNGELTGVSGKKSTAHFVKSYILNRDNHECVLCHQGEIYNNLPLTLELDHIDGNYLNNRPDNLRTLCPNCHTQTPTYGVRNLGKSTRNWE